MMAKKDDMACLIKKAEDLNICRKNVSTLPTTSLPNSTTQIQSHLTQTAGKVLKRKLKKALKSKTRNSLGFPAMRRGKKHNFHKVHPSFTY